MYLERTLTHTPKPYPLVATMVHCINIIVPVCVKIRTGGDSLFRIKFVRNQAFKEKGLRDQAFFSNSLLLF